MPHSHNESSETVIICRGKVREEFYDDNGQKIAEFVLEAGGECPGVQVPMGVYHTCVCLEPGSVIFEAKDRPYDPVGTEEVNISRNTTFRADLHEPTVKAAIP